MIFRSFSPLRLQRYCFFFIYARIFAFSFLKNLHICNFFSTFAADFEKTSFNFNEYMENFKKYLGVILLLLGVVCLIVYKCALPTNSLLVTGIVLEIAGVFAYIFINKKA